MSRFTGRTVLVTGGSRGLGAAIARGFGAEGAYVAIGCRSRAEEAEAVLRDVREAGGEGEVTRFDVADPDEVDRAVDDLAERRGGLDVAVANAAVADDGWFLTGAHEAFTEVVRTNLGGAAATCRAAARVMVRRRRGAIVTVASVAGLAASPGQASYAASKGGIVALTGTLAAELARFGVRVNCVVPGYAATGLAARLDRARLRDALARVPLRRAAEPHEIAGPVLFLASDDAAYVVGHTLVVDGGLLA